MLEPIYEKAIERKEEINSFMKEAVKNIDTSKVENKYNPLKIPDKEQEKQFAALDGSFNKKKFMGFFLYAICSQAIVSIPNVGIEKTGISGDVNTISTIESRTIDSTLSQHMNILELKSSIKTLQEYKNTDYLLLDGSIRGTLISFKTNYHLNQEFITEVKKATQELKNNLEKEDFKLDITTIQEDNQYIQKIFSVLDQQDLDDKIDIKQEVLRYAEGLEQLECLYQLLSNYADRIISVSKTSSTKDLFNEGIPDAAIIEYFCKESGYTTPVHLETNRLVRHTEDDRMILVDYPIHTDYFSEMKYTTFYTKLEDNGNVLKIELPFHATGEDINDILIDLKTTCIKGYPYILRKAHEEVVLQYSDMKQLVSMMGILDKTGRDMLEHW